MDAYVIIGKPNTRKSSVTRSLTGCFNRSVRNILLKKGDEIQIYARVSSLQESKTTAKDFIEEVNLQKDCQSVVFCLWPKENSLDPRAYPDAATYLSAFGAEKWNIVKVAVLGQGQDQSAYLNQKLFPDSKTDPLNKTAQAVRLHFEWQ